MTYPVADSHIGLSDLLYFYNKNPFAHQPWWEGHLSSSVNRVTLANSPLVFFINFMCPVGVNLNNLSEAWKLSKEDTWKVVTTHLRKLRRLESLRFLKIHTSPENITDLIVTYPHRLNLSLGLEGAYFIEGYEDEAKIRKLIKNGVKFWGLVWRFPHEPIFASEKKLTQFGKDLFSLFAEHNVALDIAHAESRYADLILTEYQGIVVDSHTAFAKVYKHDRNITETQIQGIIEKGGFIGIMFLNRYIGQNSIEGIMKHIRYFLEKFGDDHLVIGSDFDGIRVKDLTAGVEDITRYHSLLNYIEKEFGTKTMLKVAYKNLINKVYNVLRKG